MRLSLKWKVFDVIYDTIHGTSLLTCLSTNCERLFNNTTVPLEDRKWMPLALAPDEKEQYIAVP
jgi:hypothetical protein